MSRRSTLVRVGGLVALALLVGAAGWFAAVAPQRSHAKSLEARISTAQSQLVALEAARSSSSKTAALQLYQLARAMPNVDDQPGLVLALGRLANASKVKLVSIAPSPRVTLADGSAALPLTVAVNGSYGEVTQFLRRLRGQVEAGRRGVVALGRVFVVDGATLAIDKGNRVTATLTLNAFDYGAPPSATSTAGAPSGTTTTGTTATTTTPAPPAGAQAAGSTP